nr:MULTISPECIES: Rpn family recombination-promoting nuclease/putative transposase [Providencia]
MKFKHTPTAHDAAFKGFMTQVENVRDFFDIHLPL